MSVAYVLGFYLIGFGVTFALAWDPDEIAEALAIAFLWPLGVAAAFIFGVGSLILEGVYWLRHRAPVEQEEEEVDGN